MELSLLLLCSRKINEIIPQADTHTHTHTHTLFLHISSVALLSVFIFPDFQNRSCILGIHAHMLSHFSCVQLFATLWTVACQATLPTGFSRQEYWSGLPCPLPGDLPDPGIEPASLSLLHWPVGSLPFVPPGKPQFTVICFWTYMF